MDGRDLRHVTHERAIQVLRQTPSVVRMIVFRDGSFLKDEDLYDTLTVEMVKKPGRGLGFSIVGKQSDSGVFIADFVSIRFGHFKTIVPLVVELIELELFLTKKHLGSCSLWSFDCRIGKVRCGVRSADVLESSIDRNCMFMKVNETVS